MEVQVVLNCLGCNGVVARAICGMVDAAGIRGMSVNSEVVVKV